MLKALLIFASLFFLLVCSAEASPLARFSLHAEEVKNYLSQCHRPASFEQLEKSVEAWIEGQRKKSELVIKPKWDDFSFQSLSEREFKAFQQLTRPRNCLEKDCDPAGKAQFNLSYFQKKEEPLCSDLLCGVKKIFGERKGLLILWSLLKFGSNQSPLSDPRADPNGLDEESLEAIMTASLQFPSHLHPALFQGSGFFRFLKGLSLPIYKGRKVVANSFGGVFDPIDEMDSTEKTYFFLHELAHRARLRKSPSLDETDEWKLIHKESPQKISAYAATNAFEDFAESIVLYRLKPQKLFEVSKSRYDYIKSQVFDGLEYRQDLCRGSK